jgi:hypothetical protein
LEEVEQLQIGISWIADFQSGRELTPRQSLGDPEDNLAALHECMTTIGWLLKIIQKNGVQTAIDCKDGQWIEIDPIRSGLDVPMMQGGTTVSYPYFSCAPVFPDLPNNLALLPPVEMLFSPLPPRLHELLRQHALQVISGAINYETAANSLYKTVASDAKRWMTPVEDFSPLPKMWVRAVGHKEGRAARYTCWFTAPMWNIGMYYTTSVALVVAARQILHGEILARGVMTAENTFEPLTFLNEIAALLRDSQPDGRVIDECFEWLE